jgi:hypothetical protein
MTLAFGFGVESSPNRTMPFHAAGRTPSRPSRAISPNSAVYDPLSPAAATLSALPGRGTPAGNRRACEYADSCTPATGGYSTSLVTTFFRSPLFCSWLSTWLDLCQLQTRNGDSR